MTGSNNARPTSGRGAAASGALGNGLSMSECEKMIRRSLRDPKVKFLKEQLEQSGCRIGSNFVKGYTCREASGGGYESDRGVVVCCNHLLMQDQVTQVVIHELIHAYDDCRAANLDCTNCGHHACTEIRAAHLSGDCQYKRELLRGYVNIRGLVAGLKIGRVRLPEGQANSFGTTTLELLVGYLDTYTYGGGSKLVMTPLFVEELEQANASKKSSRKC